MHNHSCAWSNEPAASFWERLQTLVSLPGCKTLAEALGFIQLVRIWIFHLNSIDTRRNWKGPKGTSTHTLILSPLPRMNLDVLLLGTPHLCFFRHLHMGDKINMDKCLECNFQIKFPARKLLQLSATSGCFKYSLVQVKKWNQTLWFWPKAIGLTP